MASQVESKTRSKNTGAKNKIKPRSKKNAKIKSKRREYGPEELKPHHAKAYRKRHFGLLIFSILIAGILVYALSSTSLANSSAVKSAKNSLSSLFGTNSASPTSDTKISVNSSYGFSFQYDQSKLYASAIEGSSGNLYVGQELSDTKAYKTIKLSGNISSPTSGSSLGYLTLNYYPEVPVPSPNSTDLTKLEAQLIGSSFKNFAISDSLKVTISGKDFLKSDWQSKPPKSNKEVGSGLVARFTSYTAVINGLPFTAVLNSGISQNKELDQTLNQTIDSLKFSDGSGLASIGQVPSTQIANESTSLSLLDKLMMTSSVDAATEPALPSSSEKISTLYSSSVVKVYNFYCMDISLIGQPFVSDACSAGTGSGFFVGNEGYVATNGHVAVNNPIDIAILFAFTEASKGNNVYFSALAQVSGLTQQELNGKTTAQQVAIAVDKFYTIPESSLTTTNRVDNLLVGLNEEQPNLQELFNSTTARQKFPGSESIKQAELKSFDYRGIDGAQTGAFKASDVALIKIEGSGYPSTKLGNISSLTQGSGLSIIGYPGAAGNNQLVESTESKATLTSGKVSSIKSAAGSDSQLIETDATIGHGNSGGPAFNDNGEVVGIATYTIDGSGEGNGVFNYVRDVADLTALASESSLDISAQNLTQDQWQEGVDYFYQARYSKALKNFEKVKELYPQHPKVDQLSALAQQKIATGEEVKDFPMLLVVGASAAALSLIILALVLILRHHKKHKAYKSNEESGVIMSGAAPISPLPSQPPATQQIPPSGNSVMETAQTQIQAQNVQAPQPTPVNSQYQQPGDGTSGSTLENR